MNPDNYMGRVILGTIFDSMYTFRCGMPAESFAHTHSSFRFEDVMKGKNTRLRTYDENTLVNESISCEMDVIDLNAINSDLATA